MNSMKANIDHLILGINDLEMGQQSFAVETGENTEFGGTHPAYGTHNALCSIGASTYLEIIAPQTSITNLTGPFKGYHEMEDLTPCGWAITTQLQQLSSRMDELGIEHSDIHHGSRKTTLGDLIKWKALFIIEDGLASVNPFFLEWDDMSIHPSRTTISGGSLNEVTIALNQTNVIHKLVSDLGLPIQWEKSSKPTGELISFSLNGANGSSLFT